MSYLLPQRLVAVLVCGGMALTGFAVSAALRPQSASPSSRGTCVVQDDAYISPRDLGSFTLLINQRFARPPFMGDGSPLPFTTTFNVARLEGFVNDLALRGRYRAENDAQARALHYTVGHLPLLPLTGAIVRDHVGALEVYQTNWAFTSRDGAAAYMQALRGHGSFCAWKYGDSSRDENRKFTLDSTVETASAVPELSPGF